MKNRFFCYAFFKIILFFCYLVLCSFFLLISVLPSFAANHKANSAHTAIIDQNTEQNTLEKTPNLFLKATLYDKGPVITKGVWWRIFDSSLDKNNQLPLLYMKTGGEAEFALKPGIYFIYASFGRLTAQKRIIIKENKIYKEVFDFKAGALKLRAKLLDGTIDLDSISFSIYADNTENEETSLLIPNIKPEEIVRLPVGTYHILSKYGMVNALKRTEVKIQPNKLTEAIIEHTAAKVTLRLVRSAGGEALADTSWVIMDNAGDSLWESVGAYATVILEEGSYTVIAKNKDALYQKNITVVSGKDQHIDISTQQDLEPSEDVDDSMD